MIQGYTAEDMQRLRLVAAGPLESPADIRR